MGPKQRKLQLKPDVMSPGRRELLKNAGWTLAAFSAFPGPLFAASAPSAANAASTISPTMTQLSAYMAEAGAQALPEEVIEKAKHHILDTFAGRIQPVDATDWLNRSAGVS